jgi:hypothetical protein
MSGPEYGPAWAQRRRTRGDVLGLGLFGGGEAVTASSAKITTAVHKTGRTKREMPDPCTQRKGSERRADAEDVSLPMNVLRKRNCGCEIHSLGCFVAVAQSLAFDATRVIIQQRLLRYSSASDYMKKSLSNLEATLRRLINLQQHKLVPRIPPDQNGLLVCRDVFLYLMHVPASTYIQMVL